MKKYIIPTLCTLVLTVGCGKKQTTPSNSTNPAAGNNNAAAPLAPPAKPLDAPQPNVPSTTSFAAVTKHLDAGGDFYLYWNAQQIQAWVQDGLEKLEENVKADMPPEMRDEADQYMKLAKAAYIESGLESIDGFGASSFRSGNGLRRHKVMIHRDPAKSDGLMWKALGTAPHELGGLKLMPATTAYAVHADMDVAGTFKWLKGFIASNLPAKQGVMLAEMLEEANAEVPIEKIINGTGGEVGMYVTLNPNKMIEVDPALLEMLDMGGGPEPWEMDLDPAEMEEEGFPELDGGEGGGGEESPAPSNPKGLIEGGGNNRLPAQKGIEPDQGNKLPIEKRNFAGDDPNPNKLVAIPRPELPKLKIPEPGLVLVLKVKDDTITELLEPLLKEAGATEQTVDGISMQMIPVPAEGLPVSVSPTIMKVGEYLVFTSTQDLAKQVAAIHGGKAEGLAGTAEFKKLTNGLDLKANMITYASSQVSDVYRDFTTYMLEVQRMEFKRNAGEDVFGIQDFFTNITTKISEFFVNLNAQFLKSQVTLLSVTDEGYLIQNQTTGHMPMDPNVGLAIAGVPVAVAAATAAPAALPAMAKAKAKANRIKSLNNMKQISIALQIYAQEHGGKLPPADKWCDVILKEVGPNFFISPQDPEAQANFEQGEKVSSYAFNAALAGKSLSEIDPNVVLVFECNLGWNGTGGLADLRKKVQPDQWNIITLDGASFQANPNMLQRRQIRWIPLGER